MGREEMERFFGTFRALFEGDGRADVWAASVDENGVPHGQIIYDRHEIIFAYGPLDLYEATLRSNGLVQTSEIPTSFPHWHHYRPEFDRDVTSLLEYWEWKICPLHEDDD